MTTSSWPPSPELLAWRPAPQEPATVFPLSRLLGALEPVDPPMWLAAPDSADPDEDGELDVAVHVLAAVDLDAGRPGGGSGSEVVAVPTTAGTLRILITNDDEVEFDSPISEVDRLPTLGEVLQILDGTLNGGEVYGMGHPCREYNDMGDREALRGFLTIGSDLYPQLGPLDEARFEQWAAEGAA